MPFENVSLDTSVSWNFDVTNLNELKMFVNKYIYIYSHYFSRIRRRGFGVNAIQEAATFIAFVRFVILVIRYNIITAFAITAISVTAGCIWYQKFLRVIGAYSTILYKHPFTYRMGVDGGDLADIKELYRRSVDYQIRLTNPVGIVAYAIMDAIIDISADGSKLIHYKDPISMVIGGLNIVVPQDMFIFGLITQAVNFMYFAMVAKILPVTFFWLKIVYYFVINQCAYTYIVRVRKANTPYFIRWYWTLYQTFSYFENYLVEFIFRINQYIVNVIIPPIEYAKIETYLVVTNKIKDGHIMVNTIVFFVVVHIAFYVYVMLHAFGGQYMYIPLITPNSEVHIGPRDPNSVYSGGKAAWQTEEPSRYFWLPKVWFGWFGRGSKAPNVILIAIKYLIYKPIFNIVKMILKIVRRKK